MVCEYCATMFMGRCEHCGRVKLRDGTEKNELEEMTGNEKTSKD